mmetsp:Transcript_119838/g.310922  ORF Transcript_119838/g.310922 Transcript_119838/m.310922 type:complete len:1613 (+) Transcript_119838:118-4956(+)
MWSSFTCTIAFLSCGFSGLSTEVDIGISSAVGTKLPGASVAGVLGIDDACLPSSLQSENDFVASSSADHAPRCALGAIQIKAAIASASHRGRRDVAVSIAEPESRTEAASAQTPNTSGSFADADEEEQGLGPQWPPIRSPPARSNEISVGTERLASPARGSASSAGKEEEGLSPQVPPTMSNDSSIVAQRFVTSTKGGDAAETLGLGPQEPFRNHGQGWLAGYKQANVLWKNRGEGIPVWADGLDDIPILGSHEAHRLSRLVLLGGFGLIGLCVLMLVTSKVWLKRVLSSVSSAPSPEPMPGETGNNNRSGDASSASTEAPPVEVATTPDQNTLSVKASDLYRLTSLKEKICIGTALILSAVHGSTMPMVFFLSDRVTNAINLPNDDGTIPPTAGPHTNRDEETWYVARMYLVLACVAGLARFGAVYLCTFASDRMLVQIKTAVFRKLLQQGPAWHDVNNGAEMSARFSEDAWAFKEAHGEALINTVRAATLFISAMVLSFRKDWQLALIMAIAFPVIAATAAICISTLSEIAAASGKLYAKAGGAAEAALRLIRTVSAFNGQHRTLQAYARKLDAAKSHGVQMGFMTGLNTGIIIGMICFTMSISMYCGSSWVLEDYDHECWVSDPPFGNCRTGGSLMSTMSTMLWGFAMGLGTLALGLEIISRGRAATHRLFDIIDQPLVIDLSGGEVLDSVEGNIAFDSVKFSYPSRLSAVALNGVSLQVPAGTTAAFVGPSGSGKSTLVSVLLRFYDPQEGAVTLDGHDIRFLQVAWLRSCMALVEQEPVLFACSIEENIAFGYTGEARLQDVERAARAANAHDFVSSLPKKYQTEVGERGAQLSGGQKQRIAIARALVRNPAVLLLDEATSALDTESERIVQDALDKLLQAKQRTTLVIAHRLTTVQAADQIYVLQDGHLMEQGKHAELIAKSDSVYASLTKAQLAAADPEGTGKLADADTHDALETMPSASPTQSAPMLTGATSPQIAGKSTNDATGRLSPAAEDAESKPEPRHVPLVRLWALSRPEYGLYAFGILFTLVLAFQFPLLFARLTQLMNLFNSPPVVFNTETGAWVPDFDESEVRAGTGVLCLTMQVIGVLMIVCSCLQSWAFSKAGEALTTRLRVASLEAMIRQDMAWFDSTTSGALSTSLATEVPAIRNLLGSGLAPLLQGTLVVTVSFSCALIFSWRFTLCIMGVVPLLVLGAVAFQKAVERRAEEASSLVTESLGNVKTVSAFGLQEKLLGRFSDILAAASKKETLNRLMNGMGTGLSSAAIFLIYAFAVLFGTRFVDQGVMAPDKVTLCFFMMIAGVGNLAELVRWAERSTEGRAAANRVFELIDRSSLIDPLSPSGHKPPHVQGRIEFRDVHFWYPTRPDVRVFQGFTLTIEPNTTTALVGQSGQGKSTVVGLLQRFYDPQQGTVTLDGHDLKVLNLAWLRSQLSLVQQEPAMMSGSVLDNICYGLNEINEEKAIEAAKLANAHSFIMQLPKQYHTRVAVGSSSHLSGGQKQRIAIARAIVRNPAVLLLDEATSALDAASERIVQAALDELLAAGSRTTIVIAHRLSTVRNADQICVVHHGEVIEQGRHEELLADRDGHYSRLIHHQIASEPQPIPTDQASK